MPSYHIRTFGCQMNYSDSERMATYLEALDFTKAEGMGDADLILFNTCSIKQKAEDKVYGHLMKIPDLRAKNPNLLVVVAGCMVRTSSSRYSVKRDRLFQTMRDLDVALKTDELPQLAKLARKIHPELNIPEIKEESLEDYFHIPANHDSHESKSQAFVAISNGCDKFCTYCIVPYSRGREKSRKIEDIVSEVTALAENGCKEITLIGQTVNSYGLGSYDKEHGTFAHIKKEPFVHLLEEMDKIPGLIRVRFTSPHPMDMSDQLIEAMGDLPSQMPYLHLPVQAGDNETLKRMNRTYTVEEFRETMKKLREKIPDISVSTDIIVGFCGESEEEFQNTCDFFKEMRFEHAYLARYSDRRGTTANRFMKDDITETTKKSRWHHLNDILIAQATEALERFHGRTVNVLVESQNAAGTCLGRSENFKTIQFKSGRKLLGKIVPVKIQNSKNWILEGELV
ncbi:tRNA (N6-isopentenyl adenosine(37)-C2)-methylthiotransferase MiaB [Candidatus Gracilibacteria bacterium]|nr:tRNA (N6-isopentenyl adenosine(37)-C2)-methylthiotransferase MiaB [Candidatus Gracilibacteria bacterium]